jgi:putative chitinase
MIVITADLLRKVAGAPTNKDVVEGLAKYLPKEMDKAGINTKLRIAHFLAQIGHESDHFRTTKEYASGREYEGRHDLGNVKAGDGVKYKGRGVLQITGRANYEKYGKKLGLDLVRKPELAETPEVSVKTAIAYWTDHGLNALADKDDLRGITHKVNGGYNGLNSRLAMLENAKRAIKGVTVASVDLDQIDPKYIPKDFA